MSHDNSSLMGRNLKQKVGGAKKVRLHLPRDLMVAMVVEREASQKKGRTKS